MKRVSAIGEMKKISEDWRAQGKKIVFVPTMGFLHEGHLSLVRMGRKLGDCLVVSIFVNPLQFGPSEDFREYPRDLERDKRILEAEGVDLLFTPKEEDMYPAHPESSYGWGKLMGEYECELYSKTGMLDASILRLHNVYGPHSDLSTQKSQVIPATIRKAIQYPKEDFIIWGNG
jgi:cytidyltransferase-like protein